MYLLVAREGIHIIDLEQTIPMMRLALAAIRHTTEKRGKIWTPSGAAGTKREEKKFIPQALLLLNIKLDVLLKKNEKKMRERRRGSEGEKNEGERRKLGGGGSACNTWAEMMGTARRSKRGDLRLVGFSPLYFGESHARAASALATSRASYRLDHAPRTAGQDRRRRRRRHGQNVANARKTQGIQGSCRPPSRSSSAAAWTPHRRRPGWPKPDEPIRRPHQRDGFGTETKRLRQSQRLRIAGLKNFRRGCFHRYIRYILFSKVKTTRSHASIDPSWHTRAE